MKLEHDFPELVQQLEEPTVQLKTLPFTVDLIPHIKHLTRPSDTSGMNTWFRCEKTGTREWIGLPPRFCVVAYKTVGGVSTPIGWCGIGRFNSRIGVIGTFVAEEYRKGGVASMLVKATSHYLLQASDVRVVAYDHYSWNCSHIIKKAGLTAITIDEVDWYDKKEIES